MKNVIICLLSFFLLSCAGSYPVNETNTKKKIDPIDFLIKIIKSKDNDMLFDYDMSKYLDYSQYNKKELERISEALTEKIKYLSEKQKNKQIEKEIKKKSPEKKKSLAEIPFSRL
jgi:phosphoenolpyruvate synthase/pyruvate phosphate dikinase